MAFIAAGERTAPRAWGAEADGVAISLVLDTSGSMRGQVATTQGKREEKWRIASRALLEVIQRVENYATNTAAGPAPKVECGLFIFTATGATPAVNFGSFDATALRRWVRDYRGPNTGTPLGAAIDIASQAVLKSRLSSRHVLVITDGMNTTGPDPAVVVPRVQRSASAKNTTVFVHFVAFDIDARLFDPLKKLGVTVVGAADEKQLGSQLGFILEEKILLEKETPKK